jgi:DNA-binding IclR family transcriptional regulator
VAAILLAFRGGNSHSLTELARLTGLPVSTTHRLVGELTARRILERTEDGDYRIGLPLRMMAASRSPSRPPLLERAAQVMIDLAVVTKSSVRLGVLSAPRVAVAEVRPGSDRVQGFNTDLTPVYASALGRALLAFSPATVVDDAIAAGLVANGSGPPMRPDRLRRALAVTRLTRVAVLRADPGADVGVDIGATTRARARQSAVAVPVFGTGGAVVAALEVPVADLRTALEPVRGALVVAAGSLSRELSTVPWPLPLRDEVAG